MHGATSHKTEFFMNTAVSSGLSYKELPSRHDTKSFELHVKCHTLLSDVNKKGICPKIIVKFQNGLQVVTCELT